MLSVNVFETKTKSLPNLPMGSFSLSKCHQYLLSCHKFLIYVLVTDRINASHQRLRPAATNALYEWPREIRGTLKMSERKISHWKFKTRSDLRCTPFPAKPLQFVDLGSVRGVIINEGITHQRIVYYLAFIVEGRESLLIAFQVLSILEGTDLKT
jgi:hypothetical protein